MRTAVSRPDAARFPVLPMASLILAMFAMGMNLSFVFAALPPIGRELGLSELQIGFVVAPAAFVFVVANAIWGVLSEKLGRKRVILVAVGAAVCVSAAFGFVIEARLAGALSATSTFGLLVTARIILGALAGGLLPASQAYVADVTLQELRTRGLALTGAGFALGMISGPGLAAAVASFGPVAPFFAVATIAAVALAFAATVLRSTGSVVSDAAGNIRRTPVRSIFTLLALVVLAYSAYGIVLQVTGFRIQDELHASVATATRMSGIALVVAAAGLVATQLFLARMAVSIGTTRRSLMVGMGVALVAMIALRFAVVFAEQLVGMALLGVGLGMVLPSALGLLTISAETAGDQGRVGGLSGAAQGLGLVIGPLAGAATYRADHLAPYAVGIALLAAGFGVAFVTVRNQSCKDQVRVSAPTVGGKP